MDTSNFNLKQDFEPVLPPLGERLVLSLGVIKSWKPARANNYSRNMYQ